MMSDRQPRRRSFLLRLWRAGNGDTPEWRFALEDVQTRERRGFADLVSLVAYLEAEIRAVPPQAPDNTADR